MAKNKKKIEKPRRYRDGKTGRFVTKKFAKKHPKRTPPRLVDLTRASLSRPDPARRTSSDDTPAG